METIPHNPAQLDPASTPGWGSLMSLESGAEQNRDQRLETALEASQFQTSPELRTSLESYYDQHDRMDGLIQGSLSGELATAEQLERIIRGSGIAKEDVKEQTLRLIEYGGTPSVDVQSATAVLANVQLSRLSDPDNKRLQRAELMAADCANQALFAEPSVGVTSLSAEDKQRVIDNHGAIQAKIKESGLFTETGIMRDRINELGGTNRYIDHLARNPLQNIENAQKIFWDDVRFGGQLLFHNTNVFDEVYAANKLMTRRMQLAEKGRFNTPNAGYMGDYLHSPTPHWSEEFDDWQYRNGSNKVVGTIAVPIAELIKTAPFGRGAQYGTLRLKEQATESVIPHVVIHDGIGDIGAGSPDKQGRFSLDRTFYSSPYDCPPDAPLEEAPDGYAIPLRETSTWVQLGDEVAKTGMTFGIGEHMPKQFVIDVKDRFDKTVSSDERRRVLSEAIQRLQYESIRDYGNVFVVPLRGNVIDFWVPDDTSANGRHMANFTRKQ